MFFQAWMKFCDLLSRSNVISTWHCLNHIKTLSSNHLRSTELIMYPYSYSTCVWVKKNLGRLWCHPIFIINNILFRYPLRLRFYSVRLFFQLSHSHMQWPTHSSDKSCPNHFMTPSQAEIRISLDIYPLRTVTRTAKIELMALWCLEVKSK